MKQTFNGLFLLQRPGIVIRGSPAAVVQVGVVRSVLPLGD